MGIVPTPNRRVYVKQLSYWKEDGECLNPPGSSALCSLWTNLTSGKFLERRASI